MILHKENDSGLGRSGEEPQVLTFRLGHRWRNRRLSARNGKVIMSVIRGPAIFTHGERRSQRRYEINLDVRWSATEGNRTGVGKLRDISSKGLCFQTDGVMPLGLTVDLSIGWPILLGGTCGLQLRIKGRVLRSDEWGTAIKIVRHVFCTRKTQATELKTTTFQNINQPATDH